MFVVATAGHVDHGKSTLIRALTGMEPDRWAEERRRGLTIDLGFAWTELPSGAQVAFVDVPGHERFLPNTLAGLGPASVVCFVVAADEGWCAQSSDHRDAVAALGISHGLIVLTRADRASSARIAEVSAQVRAELAETGLRDAALVTVCAVDGTGMTELRTALDRLLARLPAPDVDGRLRLWVDRAFSITGAGTVVTGTLAAGGLACGDTLQLFGRGAPRSVQVRGVQSCGQTREQLSPVARAAVNLRGIAAADVHRGDALITPGAWPSTAVVDVRRAAGPPLGTAPARLIVHVGTAAVPARLRCFDDDHARLSLDRPLPLVFGDRLLMRDPGGQRVLGGARVLDADPPTLSRRGDGARRAAALAGLADGGDPAAEVARRGAVRPGRLAMLGVACSVLPAGVRELSGWWVDAAGYDGWARRLAEAVRGLHERDPLAGGLSRGAARDLLGLPDAGLLDALIADAGLVEQAGRIRLPDRAGELGPADGAVAELEHRLAADPFHAPEADDLAELRLGVRELAAAERAGRLLRLGAVVLLPNAPALAMRQLARLEQPFTATAAKQALGTTRRVVIPLLEHLDGRGWTRRIDAVHREVVR